MFGATNHFAAKLENLCMAMELGGDGRKKQRELAPLDQC
jgi:hypothetical protein